MASSTYDSHARRALANLDANVLSQMNENVQIVTDFNQKLGVEIEKVGRRYQPFRGASIMHGGSAYEGLAVETRADFDVLLVLGKPYVAENFIARRDRSGYFILQWNSSEGSRGSDLDAASLQEEVFHKLQACVSRVVLPNALISRPEPGLAAMHITITRGGKMISIDLAPQIVSRTWANCPDIKPLHELPRSLRQRIENLQTDSSPIFYFTPAVPNIRPTPANRDFLCDVAFSQLEKRFIVDNEVRDVVRLAKLVAYRRGWNTSEYSLKSYHVKRTAIKYYDRLRCLGLWDGCKTLLAFLAQELQSGIDGYFIANQTLYHGPDAKRLALQREINEAINKNPETLLNRS